MTILKCATIYVTWGYEEHSITLTSRNWTHVRSGKHLKIRGKGYHFEGDFFWDYWCFGGGVDGELVVSYGEDGGEGFTGTLLDAEVVEHEPGIS